MSTDGSPPGLPYQNPVLPVEQRVEDLLARMPLEDKAGLMFFAHAVVGDLPSSMAEVAAGRSDVPCDTPHPLYRLGHGLTYPAAH